jgi:hypothetical protein
MILPVAPLRELIVFRLVFLAYAIDVCFLARRNKE